MTWIAIGLASFLAWRAGRIWLDAQQRGIDPAHRLGWAVLGSVAPSHYWWGARIRAMSASERASLLAGETAALGLRRADGLICPLCGAEIEQVWALDAAGRAAVAPSPVKCPRCDFRVDACRHCVHFLPGPPPTWGQFHLAGDDITFGRCSRYKEMRPVQEICPPEIARRLQARGYDQLRAPMRIADSFAPPDCCASFEPQRGRLRASGVRWPDARRAALLRLLAPIQTPRPVDAASPDEAWLV